jgi:hypothetical protein
MSSCEEEGGFDVCMEHSPRVLLLRYIYLQAELFASKGNYPYHAMINASIAALNKRVQEDLVSALNSQGAFNYPSGFYCMDKAKWSSTLVSIVVHRLKLDGIQPTNAEMLSIIQRAIYLTTSQVKHVILEEMEESDWIQDEDYEEEAKQIINEQYDYDVAITFGRPTKKVAGARRPGRKKR